MKKALIFIPLFLLVFKSNSQSLCWIRPMGDTLTDCGQTVAIDYDNNIYCAGYFAGTVDFDPGPGVTNLSTSSTIDQAIFITKYDANGNFIWAKQIGDGTGGIATNEVNDIVVDASNNIYITGEFIGTVDFDPGPGVHNLTGVSRTIYIAKYDYNGNYIWAKMISGNGSNWSLRLALDNSGNLYTTGRYEFNADFDPGQPTNVTLTSAGNMDAYVQKRNCVTGNLIWAKSFGGTGNDQGYGVTVDNATGNVYATGNFSTTADFDPGAGTANLVSAGLTDIYVLKLNQNGNYIWAKSMGGTSDEYGRDVIVDPSSGDIIVGGHFKGTVNFNPGGSYLLTSLGNSDNYVVKLDKTNGSFIWANSYGTTKMDQTFSMTLGADGYVYTGGEGDMPTKGFVRKIDPSTGNMVWDAKFLPSAITQSAAYVYGAVADNLGYVYVTGFFYGNPNSIDFEPGSGVVALKSHTNNSSPGWDIFFLKLKSPLTVDLGRDTILCGANSFVLDAKNPGCNYIWSTGATTQTITINTTGSYAVTVTNATLYSDRDTIQVTFNNQPIVNLGPDISLCTGTSLTLDAQNAGSSYYWSTGATTQTLFVNSSGTYSVTVSNGPCTDRDTVQVTIVAGIAVNLGPDLTLCAGTPLTLDAQYAGSTFYWSTGATTQTLAVNSSGIYSVTVTNGSCSDRDTIQVTFNTQPIVNLGRDTAFCGGGLINLNSLNAQNPGCNYMWSTGSTSQSLSGFIALGGHASLSYSVTVTNGACSDRDTIQFSSDFQITVNLGPDLTICTGTSLTLDAQNAGSTYYWSTGATTQTLGVNSTGIYAVTVTNASCTDRDTIQVTFGPQPDVNLGPDIILCTATPLILDAQNAGSTYYWSTGSTTQTLSVNTTGTYSVTATNGFCTDRDTIQVTINTPFTVDLGPDLTLCIGTPLTLDAQNAGSIYVWSTGATTQTLGVNSTGSYAVTVSNGTCSDRDTIQVTFTNQITVNLGPDVTLPSGTPLTLDAQNAGSTYYWSTGANTQTLSVNTTGIYSVTVTNGSCSDRDTITVTFNPQPNVFLGNDTVICVGNTLTLDAKNPGSTYIWSTGATTQTLTVSTTSAYSVTVSNGSFSDRDTITVTFVVGNTVDLGKDTSLCTGNTLTLDAKNTGSTYIWSTGAATKTLAVTTTGTYSVTVTSGTCVDRDTINVTFNPQPLVNLGRDTTLCNGNNTLTLDAQNSGSTYLWNTTATTQTINVTSTGAYSVTVTSGTCSDRDTIQVTFITQPLVNLGRDTTLCNGSTLTLDAGNAGNSYQWSTGATTQNIFVRTRGTYSVTVSDNGCISSDAIDVDFVAPPVVNLGGDTSLCGTASLVLDAHNSGCLYHWSTGSTAESIIVTGSGTFSVSVSCSGCPPVNDEINISFTNSFYALFFPNTFTPDKNGLNDEFKGIGEGISSYDLKIFTRWGELIYETKDINSGWDGKYKANTVQYGMYVWSVDYSFVCDPGKKLHKFGNVLLLK